MLYDDNGNEVTVGPGTIFQLDDDANAIVVGDGKGKQYYWGRGGDNKFEASFIRSESDFIAFVRFISGVFASGSTAILREYNRLTLKIL